MLNIIYCSHISVYKYVERKLYDKTHHTPLPIENTSLVICFGWVLSSSVLTLATELVAQLTREWQAIYQVCIYEAKQVTMELLTPLLNCHSRCLE